MLLIDRVGGWEKEKHGYSYNDIFKMEDENKKLRSEIIEQNEEIKDLLNQVNESIPLYYGHGAGEMAKAIFGYCTCNSGRFANKNRIDYNKETADLMKHADLTGVTTLIKHLQMLCNSEDFSDENALSMFLPKDPIKAADVLINARREKVNFATGNKNDDRIYDEWKLRQIAEHLLVYCNANGEGE